MKKLSIILVLFTFVSYSYGQDLAALNSKITEKRAEAAVFKWVATDHDFGQVPIGTPVSHEFKFTNTGDIPLVISAVKPSCGCTITAYSKEPIMPNGTGFVKATYDASKVGRFSKTVTVVANTEVGSILLTIKGEVVGAGTTIESH